MIAKITHSALQKGVSKTLFVLSAVQNEVYLMYKSHYALQNGALMAKIIHSALQKGASKDLFVLSAVQNEVFNGRMNPIMHCRMGL